MWLFDKIWHILTKPYRVWQTYQNLKQQVAVLTANHEDLLRELTATRHSLDEIWQHSTENRQNLSSTQQNLADLSNNFAELFAHTAKQVERIDLLYRERFDVPLSMVNRGIIDKEIYLTDTDPALRRENEDTFYFNLANAFRGNEEAMRGMLERFLPHILDAAKLNGNLPFADIGCGRGEFLNLLRENGIKCLGIDKNGESAAVAQEQGHTVIVDDASRYLNSIADASLSGISLIMVSEHIAFSDMFSYIFLFAKKTACGGPLLINTINPYCFWRYGNFCLDPSHVNYLPPEIYKLIMEMAGFKDIKIIWSEPIGLTAMAQNMLHTYYENVTIVGYKTEE